MLLSPLNSSVDAAFLQNKNTQKDLISKLTFHISTETEKTEIFDDLILKSLYNNYGKLSNYCWNLHQVDVERGHRN